MDSHEIKALIEAFGQTGLAEMALTRGDWSLRLVRSVAGDDVVPAPETAAAPRRVAAPVGRPAPPPRPAPAAESGARAPLSGVVYLSANQGAPDFVKVGQRVEAGDVVAVIEAMKMFNEIRAERAGLVEALLIASGDEVDAGHLLMRIG